MTRFIVLAAFLSSIANAQDVPPPPKPADDGPSLADTMKFIEDKLNSIGPVNYIAYTHDNVTGNNATNKFSAELTNVRGNVAGCRIDYHWRNTRDGRILQDLDAGFPLKPVNQVRVKTREQELKEGSSNGGHPEWASRVYPTVFVISVEVGPNGNTLCLFDESLANRIAKALVHAVELCGGGTKEPF